MAWNGSSGKAASRKDVKRRTNYTPTLWLYICAGIAVLIGGAALWVHYNRSADNVKSKKNEDGRPRIIESSEPTVRRPSTCAKPKVAEKPANNAPKIGKEEWKMPAVLETEEIEEGLVLCEVPSNMPSHARNPYKSQVESLLSMLGKPGTPYTPVPVDPNMDLDADFLKAMENTIIVWEDESEQSERHKQMVNWMKQAVAEARKEGWKVGDLLRELEKERKH